MVQQKLMIAEITSDSNLLDSLKIIKDSFLTVAKELNLTEENCPSNPAFTDLANLIGMKERGISLFGLFEEEKQVGFIALEKAAAGLYYLERLSVLPEYRHRGYGKHLMDFAFNYVKDHGAEKISIGIVNENSILKNWYRLYGFTETGLKKYKHLPFTVCFLEREVGS